MSNPTTMSNEKLAMSNPNPTVTTMKPQEPVTKDYEDYFEDEYDEYDVDDFSPKQARSKRTSGTQMYTSKHIRIQTAKQEKIKKR
ncbi:UNVERIFIED_CONTAM: hypothetical protein HDU68_006843 [Siphonaria sp. JEL0065]|nr:hypothetical protein HDU68_006843 [Siphonaria sp. JEL0065]